MSPRPRVLVADDHPVMLQGLVRLLSRECDVVGAVNDGTDVLTTARKVSPDVVVIDISMPGLNGIAAATRVAALEQGTGFVFVTMHHDREYVEETMALGAVGFVVKDRLGTDLLAAIRSVLEGKPYVSPP
jgi:DNA-binding NarL/FixJ family response regulator